MVVVLLKPGVSCLLTETSLVTVYANRSLTAAFRGN